MRLIDADTFIEYLGLDTENSREINLAVAVSLEDFDRQPTAYDVEKIVEQLEEKATAYDDPASSDNGFRKYCHGIAVGYRYAADIAKKGGANED